jgi:hypothetical protein
MVQQTANQLSTVEIVTQTCVVEGLCFGLTERQRLVDLLNNPDVTHLQIFDPRVFDFTGESIGGSQSAENYLFLDKERVVLANTVESVEAYERRQQAHDFDRVERDKLNCLVFAAEFEITGMIHVAKDADPRMAIPRLYHNFFVITDARATHMRESLSWSRNFLVVNGRNIEILSMPPAAVWQAKRGEIEAA